ncbi:MAG TPA: GMC family oxidoreductase [Haliangiales bacterium]|nr:GMC family oxidoreductase [Haliangiales bacterium]
MTELAARAGERWDAIVVGSGAGGGVAAWRLATAGRRVLVLEKGPRLGRRPLVPDEIGSCRRDEFVPAVADEPHVWVADGAPPRPSYEGWTACCVGGGTVHMSAMLYRMHDEDFDAASRFGVPAGTTLADWPVTAAALRPYYDRVQRFVGLAGATGANPFEPASEPYPAPPIRAHPAAEPVMAAARAAGLHPYPTPRGLLGVAAAGRGPCVLCGFCGSYACPTGAKASTADTFLPAAEANGRCVVLPGARVVGLVPGPAVIVVDGAGARHRIAAARVLLAASAVESARLLLLSRLGGPQVGRNLLFSLETAGRATFPYAPPLFPAAADALPFLGVSVQDRYRDSGTLVFERPHPNPILRALRVAHDGPLGAPLVARLRRTFLEERELVYESFIEMLPRPGARVELEEAAVDRLGVPAARIVVDTLPGEPERAARLGAVARDVLERLGPARVTEDAALRRTTFLQGGTCRMGRDPDASVVDAAGQVHGVPGLHVVDGGALPTLGGVPPTLTIMANALRIAELLIA